MDSGPATPSPSVPRNGSRTRPGTMDRGSRTGTRGRPIMGQASACPAASPPIRASWRPARTFPSRTKGICVNLMTTDDVRTYVDQCAGRLSLNRPKALHSLNLDMVQALTRALLEWSSDPDVRIVLIDHAEGRGFC